MPHTIQSLLTQDRAALESSLSLDAGAARIEVQMLLQQVLGVSRAHLLAHPEQALDEARAASYVALLQRRMAGEPLAYVLGEREFFGLKFIVSPATLIPRPETELLVELALRRIPSHGPLRILDLGTGCGAIALSIARACAGAEVTAVDASHEALAVARENARRLDAGSVRLLRSDWFSALAGERFDLIVSNPPYIAEGDVHLEQGDPRFEPRAALVSGRDGLDDIRRIVAGAQSHLNPGGWLLLEHGYNQAIEVREILRAEGFGEIFSASDLAGIERVSGGRS